ncbi:MAG: RraA family protein [Chloroflexota bacterium]
MVAKLSPELLKFLREVDSPTIANAIETFNVRPRVNGYVGYDIKCAFPEMGSMVGYAVTCTADSTTEERPRAREGWVKLWEALAAAPKPAVIIFKDIGSNRLHSCHMGEVMGTIAKRLGAVGAVSDGGLRDVHEIKALGLQYFCPGYVVSHGNPLIVDVGMEVEISGMTIKPGDLLHGDVNGLLKIPEEIVAQLPAAVEKIRVNERGSMDFFNSPDFTIEKLRERFIGH